MLYKQKIFAIIASSALVLLIAVLIKRRKLREEYALLWLATGIGMLILVIGYPILLWLSKLIGAVAPTTTLFLFALLFIILISIHFSVKFTRVSDQMQSVITELAILRKELEDLKKEKAQG
jgi:hypothetical protein